jgi:Coenzyme PQQ synthesis protein D (PqqD)
MSVRPAPRSGPLSAARHDGPQVNKLKGTYRRSDHVAERAVGKTTYLIDCRSNTIHRLNAIGAAIWRQLADSRSCEELVTALHAAFRKTDRKTIEQDVAELLHELLDAGLIGPAE